MLHAHFSANVRRRRKELGMTQQQLADAVECDREFVAQVEAGKAGKTLGEVERFARGLRCSPLALLVPLEDVAAVA